MTIELHDVMKKVRQGSVRLTYKDVNMRIEEKSRMALLGHSSSGLDFIVDLICGADAPDKGVVRRSHSVSWAIPEIKYVHKHLPLVAAVRFIARLYEIDEKAFLARVLEQAQVGEVANLRVDRCPREVVSRLAFCIGTSLPFDQYILKTLGSKEDRERNMETVNQLAERAGLLFVTSDVKTAKQFCTEAYVFDEGRVTYFDNMDAAAEFFSKAAGDDDVEDDFFDAEQDLQDLVNVDF
ncbi:MAG: hypothetical protein WDM89_00745 [Rhizomicrobium sp.]